MFASFKALKCQSGAEKKRKGDEGLERDSPPPSRSAKPALARRISRWKKESPIMTPLEGSSNPDSILYNGLHNEIIIKTTTVSLERDDGTLGITLRGGMLPNNQLSKPVVITQLKPGGPAAKNGCLKPGDRLIAVNGVSLRGSSLSEAQSLLQQPGLITTLTVEYDVKLVDKTKGPMSVDLERLADEDLGLTIFQSHEATYIGNVKCGSIADRCGALSEGDQILAVNNRRIDGKAAKLEHVYGLMEENIKMLRLEILPMASLQTKGLWRERGKAEDASGSRSCGWYGNGAVTHSEKLHTTLTRDETGFGLRFGQVSNDTILITEVHPNSPAERCGVLYPRDRVLAVNHRDVAIEMLTVKDAMDLLESSPAGRLSLHVEFDVLDTVVPASGVFNVRLMKRGTSGLGLTIAATKDNDFVVCEVKKGSPAHRAGSLLPGDRLLAVNGTPIDLCSVEHIAQILHHGDDLINLQLERSNHPTDLLCHRKVTCTVELQRYGGPIGITIAGSEEPGTPITVSGLTAGGLAEQTGALLVGDEIQAINDHSLLGEPLSAAHALLQTSPDLVVLKISRCITPNGRTMVNTSPLQPPSVDSAVESWGSSYLDLTPSPDQCRPTSTGTIQKHPPDWKSSGNKKEQMNDSQLLEQIANENLNIQRELEMLSQQINVQNINEQNADWQDNARAAKEITGSGAVQMNHPPSTLQNQDRDSCVPSQVDNFEMSQLTENHRWQFLNTSQPSLRSEFQAYTLLTVELKKDPVYEDFGFSVSDGLYERGVFINRIRKGGPADLCQCLLPYDRILQVNETCTQDFDCCLTVPLMASAGEALTLLIARASNQEMVDGQFDNYFLSESERTQPQSAPFTSNYRTMKIVV